MRNQKGVQGVILVEAKAHPAEMESSCGAENPKSIEAIDRALALVQDHMRVAKRDWKTRYYQLANRLAFLYFLNNVVKVPTWLALLNFVGDTSHRPTTITAWADHYRQVFDWLGAESDSPLLDRMILLYPTAECGPG